MGNTHRRLLGMTLALALLATGCSSGELDSPFRQNGEPGGPDFCIQYRR